MPDSEQGLWGLTWGFTPAPWERRSHGRQAQANAAVAILHSLIPPPPTPPSRLACRSQGVQLSHIETKRLLLSSVDPSASPETAATTITGGRLNVAAAMQALALLLKSRGLPPPPGFSADDAGAVELKRRMQQTPWGRQLLAGAAIAAGPAGPAGAAVGAVGAVAIKNTDAPASKAAQAESQPVAEKQAAPAPVPAPIPAPAAAALAASAAPRHHRRLRTTRHA